MNHCQRDFSGKRILIIGATSGIGKGIVAYLSTTQAQLILSGRSLNALNVISAALPPVVQDKIVCDLREENDMDALVDRVTALDGVVFCSGINKRLPLKIIKPSAISEVFTINVFGFILLISKLFKSGKLNQGASVVALSSVASQYASLGNILYMSTKGALESAIKGMALELAKYKIRVNAVRPGMINTNLTSSLTEEIIKNDLAKYPLQRYGTPEDVAYAVAYLLSEESSWLTGSYITMDGGLTLSSL